MFSSDINMYSESQTPRSAVNHCRKDGKWCATIFQICFQIAPEEWDDVRRIMFRKSIQQSPVAKSGTWIWTILETILGQVNHRWLKIVMHHGELRVSRSNTACLNRMFHFISSWVLWLFAFFNKLTRWITFPQSILRTCLILFPLPKVFSHWMTIYRYDVWKN